MRIDIGWLLFAGIVMVGLTAKHFTANSNNFYDKRNWACAEYEANQRTNVPECVRLERAVNK